MQRWVWVLLFSLALTGCGGSNPYLEQSLKPAELQGKDKAWFEKGKDDPEITLIKVRPLDVKYWDTKSNRVVSLIKILGAALTGKSADDGIEGKLAVNLQK